MRSRNIVTLLTCYVAVATILLLQTACNADEDVSTVKHDSYYHQRQQMVENQLRRRDITDELVLEAMSKVLRHEFVPERFRSESYADGPLPIGSEQTISQPYIVALMTQLAQVDSNSVVLDVGTGSGYQAAVLAEIVKEVYTIEIVEPLCERADSTLSALGYENVFTKCGDGYRGWPEAAPFDAIIVAAAADHVPQPLVDQLKAEGRMIIPIGERAQELMTISKSDTGAVSRAVIPVRFVPMTGEAEED